jgi:hypothetical protein
MADQKGEETTTSSNLEEDKTSSVSSLEGPSYSPRKNRDHISSNLKYDISALVRIRHFTWG